MLSSRTEAAVFVFWCSVLSQRQLDTLFATILDDGHNLVGAERCSMFFVDEDKGQLWTKVATDSGGVIKARVLRHRSHGTAWSYSKDHVGDHRTTFLYTTE